MSKTNSAQVNNDELFRFIDRDEISSEKITAPRYSYWKSVFRVFFRKKINIILIVLFMLLIASSFIIPIFAPYNSYENVTDAKTYNLSPKAVSKVNYLNEGTSNQWKALTGAAAGSDGYIKNTVSYSFLLEPEETLVFGLTRVDETSFTPYGETSAKLEAGKVYLAYWDHLKLGAPYFGIADNNHFNTYTKK